MNKRVFLLFVIEILIVIYLICAFLAEIRMENIILPLLAVLVISLGVLGRKRGGKE